MSEHLRTHALEAKVKAATTVLLFCEPGDRFLLPFSGLTGTVVRLGQSGAVVRFEGRAPEVISAHIHHPTGGQRSMSAVTVVNLPNGDMATVTRESGLFRVARPGYVAVWVDAVLAKASKGPGATSAERAVRLAFPSAFEPKYSAVGDYTGHLQDRIDQLTRRENELRAKLDATLADHKKLVDYSAEQAAALQRHVKTAQERVETEYKLRTELDELRGINTRGAKQVDDLLAEKSLLQAKLTQEKGYASRMGDLAERRLNLLAESDKRIETLECLISEKNGTLQSRAREIAELRTACLRLQAEVDRKKHFDVLPDTSNPDVYKVRFLLGDNRWYDFQVSRESLR